jgi:hypothetical protein
VAEHLGGVDDLKDYLRVHRRDVGFCPFLADDGACGIYQFRPLSCRSLVSTRESRWCGADFSSIPEDEKRRFTDGLDAAVVSFPTHYVRSIQEAGEELESAAARQMARRFGFSIYGNFPILVHLVLRHSFAAACADSPEAVEAALGSAGFAHPLMVTLSRCGIVCRST